MNFPEPGDEARLLLGRFHGLFTQGGVRLGIGPDKVGYWKSRPVF